MEATEAQKELYCGADLHGNNVFLTLCDGEGQRVMQRRVKANLAAVNTALEPYWDRVKQVAVESTYNHCHPAMTSRICWILFQIGTMELERGVSDLSSILAFREAGTLPNSRNACRKKRLRSSHGLGSSRAVPPLRCPLPR